MQVKSFTNRHMLFMYLSSSPTTIFKSFEISTITLKLAHSKLTVYNVYRPPSSSAKSRATSPFSPFLKDFQTLVSMVSTTPHEFLVTGDFNVHVDDLTDSCAVQFLTLLDQANLT
jgi:exonuclease III